MIGPDVTRARYGEDNEGRGEELVQPSPFEFETTGGTIEFDGEAYGVSVTAGETFLFDATTFETE